MSLTLFERQIVIERDYDLCSICGGFLVRTFTCPGECPVTFPHFHNEPCPCAAAVEATE